MDIIDEKRLFHAYIIRGGEEGLVTAKNLAAAMVCADMGKRPCHKCPDCTKAEKGIHPDIAAIGRERGAGGVEKREITVEQVRAIRRDAAVMPNEADKKVYIINDAGSMNRSAQNAMLKLLEEPPSHAAFILIEENPDKLLATVRSRCITINAREGLKSAAEESLAHELAREGLGVLIKGDSLAVCAFAIKLEKLDRQAMGEFLELSKALLAERLRGGILKGEKAEAQERILSILENFDKMTKYHEYNVSSGHIAGLLSVI